jgi:ATP-dependent metalloprotease
VGAQRIRQAFNLAKKTAPAIIFIDEIDAIGGSRQGRGEEHSRTTVNQLLVEMDGFNSADNVIVIAATNSPETLDHALTRPGRFDQQIVMPLPDTEGRREIIEHYMKKIKHFGPDVDPVIIARGTSGCSGADLFNILNTAAIEASKLSSNTSISMNDIEKAKDKIFMGSENKSRVLPEEIRKSTAYHEGGHALVALKTKGAMPIHKATILPRGNALGMVTQLPEDDRFMQTYRELVAELDVCMGGRVAEEIVYGSENVSTGAYSDFQQAKSIATKMVQAYGMSEVGPVDTRNIDPRLLSKDLKNKVNEEIDRILQESYSRTKQLLQTNRKDLDTLAKALLEYDTLSKDEIVAILSGKKLQKLKRAGS